MNIDFNVLSRTERIIYSLRSLYMKNGYRRYRMSKFEEYDLYSRNKSFLLSEAVITFTDTDGKLMALKPDVTLSIVKNTRDGVGTQRLCYNENVYRVAGTERSFKEIMQTGIECIGEVSQGDITSTLTLAADSLNELSDSFILEISDLDILGAFVAALKPSEDERERILELIKCKSLHELDYLCAERGFDEKAAMALKGLIKISDDTENGLIKLKALCESAGLMPLYDRLSALLSPLANGKYAPMLRLDFSLAGDMNYYNGLIFKGYIEGIPEGVLSGGQYDRLMQKLGRRSRAIGFAVYLDRLERLEQLKGGSVC